MIKFEKYEVVGWEHAIRGMRNPMNSWERSDSKFNVTTYWDEEQWLEHETNQTFLGEKDHELMMKLAKGGPVHAKYRRMIAVYVDITAPLYWWKEFDTYKVGTVANSCSTMHKIHEKEFTLEDFSYGLLDDKYVCTKEGKEPLSSLGVLNMIIDALNYHRERYLETKGRFYWDQMIQLLPSSYNQKRTVMLNYEVLAGIYPSRKNHKLDEWHSFCNWIETLPYSEIITGGKEE